MREPAFWWREQSWQSVVLSPVAALFGNIVAKRMAQPGVDAGVPVICVGNFHQGGAGKTPAVIAIVEMLRVAGEKPFVLSRGYGGALPGPVRVDVSTHKAHNVGDEPLVIARHAPIIVARDRAAGAAAAREEGATVIVMDDGFQNPSLKKDLSLIVADASRGIGNGKVSPAGPLRAPLDAQMPFADALLVVGEGEGANGLIAAFAGKPVLRARIAARASHEWRGKRVLAFAGIGNPDRFYRTLAEYGANVEATSSFDDHHAFNASELAALRQEAKTRGLQLATTEKDYVRIAALGPADDIHVLPVVMRFEDEDKVRALLEAALAR